MFYDYVIVGAGPCGLTLATLLASLDKSVIIIEKENVIGGCHRVERVDEDIFTEHGPRVYSSAFKNFSYILTLIGTSFNEIFTPYKFSISDINNQSPLSNFKCRELALMVKDFLQLVINTTHGQDVSMYEYTLSNGFSKNAIDYIDRICRLTDGVDMTRFSLCQFLSLVNQSALYTMYQPRIANDRGLFKIWGKHLEDNDVLVETKSTITIVPPNRAIVNKTREISFGKLVMCVPPRSMLKILESSVIPLDIFAPAIDTLSFVRDSMYNTYLSMTFMWKNKIPMKKLQGFPVSEWGIIFLVLSDYFQEEYPVMMSVSVSILDTLDNRTGKTANETESKEELMECVYYQIKDHLGINSLPDKMVMNPGTIYENGWTTKDTSFANTSNSKKTFHNYYPIQGRELQRYLQSR